MFKKLLGILLRFLPLHSLRSYCDNRQSGFANTLPQTDPHPLAFYPPLLRHTDSSRYPLARKVLSALLILFAALLIWALIGKFN